LYENFVKDQVDGFGTRHVVGGGCDAVVLVYEGFDYSLANNATINGASATVSGCKGIGPSPTTCQERLQFGFGFQRLSDLRLSFGTAFAPTEAGSVKLNTNYNWSRNARTTATIPLDATASGTVWCGYLVNYATIGNANGGYAREGIATSSGGAAINLASQLTSNTLASDRKLSVSYDNTLSSSGNISFATGTTYLYLSKYTNVGLPLSGSQTGVATTWVMTQPQFETWVAGGASEATLGANATVSKADTATTGTYGNDAPFPGFLRRGAAVPSQGNPFPGQARRAAFVHRVPVPKWTRRPRRVRSAARVPQLQRNARSATDCLPSNVVHAEPA
jgi:hypothetical protein